MLVSEFDFDLPEELIADRPLEKREDARLLRVFANGDLEDRRVGELPEIFPDRAIVVMNDTKVIPARLFGLRGDRVFEVLLHKDAGGEIKGGARWLAYIRGSKKLSTGDTLEFAESKLTARVDDKQADGSVELEFNMKGAEFFSEIEKIGHTPLPPYIKREDDETDKHDYQTVYAKDKGSVAAPTAGLHWTSELMDACRARGVEFVFLTLHIGAGTFQPVKVDDTKDHKMHAEYGVVSDEAAAKIRNAKREGRAIVAVGTTSMRLLESAVDKNEEVQPFAAETDIFITPGFDFKVVEYLMTNFHLPKSTLFMLVSAFSGLETMKKAYEFAKEHKYRFYSYGDSSLLQRKPK